MYGKCLIAASFVFVVATTSCTDAGAPESADELRVPPLVEDSAGVRIVTNREPQWGPDEGWRVAPEPVVSLGGADDPLGHIYFRVIRASRLSDGSIAALVGGTSAPAVVIVSPEGELVRTIGRQGRGPGEFIEPQFFQRLPGDTLVVWERGFGRVTVLDTAGSVLSTRQLDLARATAPLQAGGPGRQLALPLPDGSFLGRGDAPRTPVSELPLDRSVRDSVLMVRVRPDYRADTLGWFPWTDRRGEVTETGERREWRPLVGRVSLPTVGGRPWRIAIGTGDPTLGIQLFDQVGRLELIIRSHHPEIEIDASAREGLIRDLMLVSGVAPDREAEAFRSLDARLARTPSFPAFVQPTIDDRGFVWSGDWRVGNESVYSVFDPDGVWLGRLEVPLARIDEIGEDYILGWRFDDMFLESIHMLRLDRSGGG